MKPFDFGIGAIGVALVTIVASAAVAQLSGQGRAIDGDTVSIDFRLSGVDSLERQQMCQSGTRCVPCGKVAQRVAARLLSGGNASIHLIGSQSHGRPVAIVTIKGADLGESLVRHGFAVPVPKYLTNDPVRARRYFSAYNEAKHHRRGMHATRFFLPEQWRRGARLSCERKRGG